ncbi:MAG: hypothetical protein PHR35_11720, partial [Kiritimatiellae bacterium]|nr:hypothetical protein [Kiritimatiellia bacterium]
DHFLQLNGAAILYGLLRGHVAQITAQGPHGQFLLPTLNFLELQKQAAAKRDTPAKSLAPDAPDAAPQ